MASTNLSRRGFLQLTGGAATAACGAALAGCAASKQSSDGSMLAGSGSSAQALSAAAGSSEAPQSAEVTDAGSMSTEDIDPALLEGTAEDPDAELIYAVAPNDPYGTGKHHATIEVEGYGTMEVTLDADVAPITTSNFCRLANVGFYDGLTFFRIIPGFMIQGGDPFGNGTGGARWNIKGEFRANGVNNKLLLTRGAIAMARGEDDYDSASSQFFIMQAANYTIDGQYAVFGHLTSGIEVVDSICENVTDADENGMVSEANQVIISKVTILD